MTTTFRLWRSQSDEVNLPGASSMGQALSVAAANPNAFRFRLNRELIDLYGDFLLFSFEGEDYVAKKTSIDKGNREVANARYALEHLEGMSILPVVPKVINLGDVCWLVTPYLGRTVHENLMTGATQHHRDAFKLMFAQLTESGVHWAGFAPRNLIWRDDQQVFHAIDWEDVEVSCSSTNWSLRTLLKIALNWSLLFGSPYEAFEYVIVQAGTASEIESLDEFEAAYTRLVSGELSKQEAFKRCLDITFCSEAAAKNLPSDLMTPQEIGHLVSDLFGSPIDVWYASQVSALRHDCAHAVDIFVHYFTRQISSALMMTKGVQLHTELRKAAARSMLSLLDAAFDWSKGDIEKNRIVAAERNLGQIEGVRGAIAAARRSQLIDEIVLALLVSCKALFNWDHDVQLLFRGSSGQGLISSVSDVDFEISSPKHPAGVVDWEILFIQFLNALGVEVEGSSGRPNEADIHGTNWTRDATEWLELRTLSDSNQSRPWPFLETKRSSYVCNLGSFEASGLSLSPKHVWYAARSFVARAAAKYGEESPITTDQLRHLRRVKGPTQGRTFQKLVERALEAYEAAEEPDLGPLLKLLQELAFQEKLPVPGFE